MSIFEIKSFLKKHGVPYTYIYRINQMVKLRDLRDDSRPSFMYSINKKKHHIFCAVSQTLDNPALLVC